jgi:hypothetical protein
LAKQLAFCSLLPHESCRPNIKTPVLVLAPTLGFQTPLGNMNAPTRITNFCNPILLLYLCSFITFYFSTDISIALRTETATTKDKQ